MTDVAKRCIGYVLAGLIALGFVLYVFRQIDGYFGGNADRATTVASTAMVKLHLSQARLRAHLLQVERDKQAVSSAATALADALRDSAPEARSPDAIAWKAIADTTRIGAAACFQALMACQARAENAEIEAANAIAQLGQQVKVRDHPWGVWLGGGIGTGGKWEAMIGFGRRVLRLPWP